MLSERDRRRLDTYLDICQMWLRNPHTDRCFRTKARNALNAVEQATRTQTTDDFVRADLAFDEVVIHIDPDLDVDSDE